MISFAPETFIYRDLIFIFDQLGLVRNWTNDSWWLSAYDGRVMFCEEAHFDRQMHSVEELLAFGISLTIDFV